MNQTRVVHCKNEDYDVYIGRPSKYGNPFILGKDGNREKVIEKYRHWIINQVNLPGLPIPPTIEEIVEDLQGKVLGCWCKPNACHGDVLVEIINNFNTSKE